MAHLEDKVWQAIGDLNDPVKREMLLVLQGVEHCMRHRANCRGFEWAEVDAVGEKRICALDLFDGAGECIVPHENHHHFDIGDIIEQLPEES